MSCKAKPEYEVLWAEGMAHAWFCTKHLNDWLKESVSTCAAEGFHNKNCELDSLKKIDGKASIKFGENETPNILDSFLSKITMPKVNEEKKEETGHNQEPVGLQDSDEILAPVHPSDTQEGEEITLEEILPFFKSFYKSKPYVSLVGGLANNGKTKGDIDVFIRSKVEDVATEFRIYRMFPLKYRSRIHILYTGKDDDCYGVYTNYIDLFDLKLESRDVKHLELMSAIDERKGVELFKFSKLLKPAHGRFKGELYSIDSLIELVNSKPEWYEKKIVVNIKYDGINSRVDHKRDGAVKIWTEEGNEITDKLPTIVSELKEICNGKDVVVVGELESWSGEIHNPRQRTAAIIHTKGVHKDEGTLKLNIFDCLYYD